jgi:sodium transport system permease protein
MRAIFVVLRKEVRENLRERRTVMSALLLGPVFVPLLFAGMLTIMLERNTAEADRPLLIAVAHGERAPNLLTYLTASGVRMTRVDYDDAQARDAVRMHRHKVVLLIPPEYPQQITAAGPAPVLLYADASDAANDRSAPRLRVLLAQYASELAHLRLIARGIDPLVLSVVAIQDVDVSTPASRSVLVLGILSYLLLLTMLTGGLYLAIDTTAGERERGSLEPLLTTPVRREYLIYGKILATCAFMLLSLTLTCTALAIMLRFVGLERLGMSVNFGPATALAIIGVCLPFAPLGAALMTVVAAFTRTYREAQTYLGLVMLVPTLPLAFAGALGLRPTAALMAIPSLSQHFLITSVLRDEPIAASHLALSVGVTLALAIALALFAGRLYHREKLLG